MSRMRMNLGRDHQDSSDGEREENLEKVLNEIVDGISMS
jgi:hypothetical protein